MTYRVFDTEENRWIWNNIYLTPNGELYTINQSSFGWNQVPSALSGDRYVYHTDIDLCDKNNKLVYEGDYIRAQVTEDKSVVGLVAYAFDLSAYVILCVDSDEFYTLGSSTSPLIEVIGNVFDGYNQVNEDDQQAL